MWTIWLTFWIVFNFSCHWFLYVVNWLVSSVLSYLVSSIMNHELIVALLDNSIIRVINSFVFKWMVCNRVVFVFTVLHVLKVGLKVVWLWGYVFFHLNDFRLCISQPVLRILNTCSFDIRVFWLFKVIYAFCG